jgi:hypothetical protein
MPRGDEEIGKGRWLVTVLIEPNPHIRQSLGQIVSHASRLTMGTKL